MTSIPKSHQAIGHTSAGSGVVAFQVPTELPESDEVLVRVLYAVVGPVDLWHSDYNLLDFGYPSVFGVALVGEVVKAGETTVYEPGEKVFSFSVDVANVKGKAFQEYATLSKWSIGRVCPPSPNFSPLYSTYSLMLEGTTKFDFARGSHYPG